MISPEIVLFGGIPVGPELLIILLIVVLLFGAQKIPKLARSAGQSIGEFKKGREELEAELKSMERDITGEESTTVSSGTESKHEIASKETQNE